MCVCVCVEPLSSSAHLYTNTAIAGVLHMVTQDTYTISHTFDASKGSLLQLCLLPNEATKLPELNYKNVAMYVYSYPCRKPYNSPPMALSLLKGDDPSHGQTSGLQHSHLGLYKDPIKATQMDLSGVHDAHQLSTTLPVLLL